MVAGDGFKVVRKHKISPEDWKCPTCSSNDDVFWVFKKHSCCPGRPGQGGCGKQRNKNSLKYCNSKEGKAEAEAKDKAASGGGGGGAAAADANKAAQEVKRLGAEKKRLEDEVRKLKKEKAEAIDDGGEEDEEGDDEDMSEPHQHGTLSKTELDRRMVDAEAEHKFFAARLKNSPKESRYITQHEEAKKRISNLNEALRRLEDPADQLRHKAERIKKLGNQEKKLREKLRETAQVIEDAETEADTLRIRIHDINDEMEKGQK